MTHLNQSLIPPTLRQGFLIRSLRSLDFWGRFILFCFFWLLLTGWQPSSWGVGAVFIITASGLSFYLAPERPKTVQCLNNPTKVISFFCYFFVQSLRGGWDTAKLALIPKSTLSPGVIRYPIDLVNESQIFIFMQVLSLLPGTVSAQLNGRELSIHVLDLNSFNQSEIDDCLERVRQLLVSAAESSNDGHSS